MTDLNTNEADSYRVAEWEQEYRKYQWPFCIVSPLSGL